MKIAIIGSGFFGLGCAFELSKLGHEVNIFEKEKDILQGASKKNQFRFHLGYHYPRSQETVDELKKANRYFTKFYSNTVFGNTKNYYAISKNKSKISLKSYLKFIKKNNLYIKNSNIFYNKNVTSSFYLTKEKNLNYFKFKKLVKKKIINKSIKIFKKTEFLKKNLDNYDKIIVCSYSQNNFILKKLGIKKIKKYRYELVEKILVKLQKKYRNKSFIVMDGEFACLDPYLGTNYHLLSDVKNSKIEILNSKFPNFKNKLKNLLKKNLDKRINQSNFYKFKRNCLKYFPFLEKIKFIGSFKVIRTLSLNNKSKKNDERLSYITIHSKKIISILAGKWNTSIYIAKKLGEIIEK
ncbi:MAG: amino acid oxidase [Rickettsiales bacterium]|nr:amino acid oxidase [Rickettsiales bacterium]